MKNAKSIDEDVSGFAFLFSLENKVGVKHLYHNFCAFSVLAKCNFATFPKFSIPYF